MRAHSSRTTGIRPTAPLPMPALSLAVHQSKDNVMTPTRRQQGVSRAFRPFLYISWPSLGAFIKLPALRVVHDFPRRQDWIRVTVAGGVGGERLPSGVVGPPGRLERDPVGISEIDRPHQPMIDNLGDLAPVVEQALAEREQLGLVGEVEGHMVELDRAGDRKST